MTKEEALQLLQGLGDTAEEVASVLQIKGILGNRLAARSCPISRFLQTSGAGKVASCSDNIYLYNTDTFSGEYFIPPTGVTEFIRMFDAGKFPALIGV